MMDHFRAGVLECGLDVKQMVQISMDGPNVNWAFIYLMKKTLLDNFDSTLINIGSSGARIVHNSFKAGITSSGMIVSKFLSSLFYLLKDSPPRKEDYVKASGSSPMPLKFVSHRWLENVPVCTRSLEILPNIQAYVKAVNEKTVPRPSNKSCKVVSTALQDKLLSSKLHFFKCIAGHLQPFLSIYQTDRSIAVDGLLNIDISKPLLVSAGMARQQYDKYLEDGRGKKKTDQEQRRRKHILEEIDELKTKKGRLNSEIVSLTESANEWADKAESVGNLDFI